MVWEMVGGAFSGTTGDVMASLELMPSRIREAKSDRIRPRHRALAEDLHQAGFLSAAGLRAVMER